MTEDSHTASPLYSLHSSSAYKFSHDLGGVTTPGRSKGGPDNYILLPTRPTPPLFGCGDAPVRGYDEPPPHSTDIANLTAHGYVYRDPAPTNLPALQAEARKATKGLNIFNENVGINRPPDPKDRCATYTHLPDIPKA